MKTLLITAGLATLLSVAAQASTITYNTSGSELCVGASGCGVFTQTIGSVMITFNAIASSTVMAEPTTFGSFGELVLSCVGGGTACGSQSLNGINLYINVMQSAPSSGNGSIPGGVIAGTVSGTASSASITWPVANSITIGDIKYSIANNPLALVPPSVNNGVTSVQAVITDNTVPEPSTYAMLASGLLGLGIFGRRRK